MPGAAASAETATGKMSQQLKRHALLDEALRSSETWRVSVRRRSAERGRMTEGRRGTGDIQRCTRSAIGEEANIGTWSSGPAILVCRRRAAGRASRPDKVTTRGPSPDCAAARPISRPRRREVAVGCAAGQDQRRRVPAPRQGTPARAAGRIQKTDHERANQCRGEEPRPRHENRCQAGARPAPLALRCAGSPPRRALELPSRLRPKTGRVTQGELMAAIERRCLRSHPICCSPAAAGRSRAPRAGPLPRAKKGKSSEAAARGTLARRLFKAAQNTGGHAHDLQTR